MTDHPEDPGWNVYIIRCGDGSLYTGIARDLSRRRGEHRSGKGSKYLRGKGPLEIVFSKHAGTKGLALQYESRIKKLPRSAKLRLISEPGLIAGLLYSSAE